MGITSKIKASKLHHTSYKITLTILLSLSVLLFLAILPSYLTSISQAQQSTLHTQQIHSRDCNYSDGRWVYDANHSPRYDESCSEIFKGWNCISNKKPNSHQIYKWKWIPWNCHLPHLDPHLFLHLFSNTTIGFVGDSLNRNMFVALVCTLRRVSKNVKKWRPLRADRGFTFVDYNLTLSYHRTNLLARYARWSAGSDTGTLEQLGYKEGFRVDVDIPDDTWSEVPKYYDVLLFNTGHWWWAPSKFDPVKSPMLFFENGKPLLPPRSPEEGLDIVLEKMIHYVEKASQLGTLKIFRTQSPRHFEGGEWNQGGTCSRLEPLSMQDVDNLFAIERNGTNVETRLANSHLLRVTKNSSFHILDITHISEFRADAHPSTWGGKKHDDCMHWCLPGITDTWNDLLMATLVQHWRKDI